MIILKFKKLLSLFLCFLGILAILICVWCERWGGLPYFKPEFSDTGYTNERQVLKKILQDDIELAQSLGEKNVVIQIARSDLNSDGAEEVFVQLLGRGLNGSVGSPVYIFQVNQNGNWHPIWHVVTRGELWIKKSKHGGFFDFIRIGPDSHFSLDQNFVSEYHWSKGRYEYSGSRSLTNEEKGIFYEKNL